MTPKISEPAFNVALGSVMGRKHPHWRGHIGIEQTGVLREGAGLRPDIMIRHPGGLPVVIETEYSPAPTVEKDARARLGKMLQGDGRPIEQAIALRIPNSLMESLDLLRLQWCAEPSVHGGKSTAPHC